MKRSTHQIEDYPDRQGSKLLKTPRASLPENLDTRRAGVAVHVETRRLANKRPSALNRPLHFVFEYSKQRRNRSTIASDRSRRMLVARAKPNRTSSRHLSIVKLIHRQLQRRRVGLPARRNVDSPPAAVDLKTA